MCHLFHFRTHRLSYIPVNTKDLYHICTMLDQRRRRWAGVVQMLYKCLMFTVMAHHAEMPSQFTDKLTDMFVFYLL